MKREQVNASNPNSLQTMHTASEQPTQTKPAQQSVDIDHPQTIHRFGARSHSNNRTRSMQKIRKAPGARNGLLVAANGNRKMKNKNPKAISHHFAFDTVNHSISLINRHTLSSTKNRDTIRSFQAKIFIAESAGL
jgi:hypothetical protein